MDLKDPTMENYLAHYGVLGMKWGVRKAESRERIARGEHTSEPGKLRKAGQAVAKAGKSVAELERRRMNAAKKLQSNTISGVKTAAKKTGKFIKSNKVYSIDNTVKNYKDMKKAVDVITRKEYREQRKKFYEDKAKKVVETAIKNDKHLIIADFGDGQGRMVRTGKEFTKHLSSGGSFNAKTSDVFAIQTSKGYRRQAPQVFQKSKR